MDREVAAMDDHCAACAKQIDDEGFDVLFANACKFFRTTSIARFSNLPSALYLGEPYRWLYEALPGNVWAALPAGSTLKGRFKDLRTLRNRRVQVREEITNAKAFTRILVNSWYSRESVLRSYGIESTVCYLGIDTGRFKSRGLERENFVIGLGSVTPEKRLEFAIHTVGAMRAPRPPLVWVGNVTTDEYKDEITALAAQNDVRLSLHENITDDELTNLLSRARVMLYAPRLEPFGLAPLEANACEVPVVAVPEGGIRETIQDGINGFLVPQDPRVAAAALERLISDPTLAETLGSNGRRMVLKNFSFEGAAERIEAQLGEIAGRQFTSRQGPP
jgi:glycosyltransferase involved in cell wall biosynthesis